MYLGRYSKYMCGNSCWSRDCYQQKCYVACQIRRKYCAHKALGQVFTTTNGNGQVMWMHKAKVNVDNLVELKELFLPNVKNVIEMDDVQYLLQWL